DYYCGATYGSGSSRQCIF
nr:immunoglobulin light chain junction region [Macaca mulatta]